MRGIGKLFQDTVRQGSAPPGSVPMAKGDPIIGNARAFATDPIGTLLRWRREYGDVVGFRMAAIQGVFFAHPDPIRAVLRGGRHELTKRHWAYQQMKIPLGDGLLTSDGDFWLRQRRMAQPSFRKRRIAGFADTMVAVAERTGTEWERAARSGEAVDVNMAMLDIALRIISDTMFGADLTVSTEEIADWSHEINFGTSERIRIPLPFLFKLPLPMNRRFEHALTSMHDLMREIIDERRRSGESRDDLLQMYLEAVDEETGEGMDDEQLRNEVLTVFAAGHETTAHALTWTFYLLSLHPAVLHNLWDELDGVLGGRSPRMEDFGKLQYTRQVFQESMRLFPPAWIVDRRVEVDMEIGGYELAADTIAMVSPYVTHRHPEFWPNPEGFDPDRFAPDRAPSDSDFTYFPFGGGPRICIGNHFAMMEGVLVLATLAQKYRLDLVPGHPVEMEPLITLRPKHGMLMTVHAR